MAWLIAREKQSNKVIRAKIISVDSTLDSGGTYETFKVQLGETKDYKIYHSYNLQWFIVWNQPKLLATKLSEESNSILKEVLKLVLGEHNIEKQEWDLQPIGEATLPVMDKEGHLTYDEPLYEKRELVTNIGIQEGKMLKVIYRTHEGELYTIEAPANCDLKDFAMLIKEAGHPKAVIVKMETIEKGK